MDTDETHYIKSLKKNWGESGVNSTLVKIKEKSLVLFYFKTTRFNHYKI